MELPLFCIRLLWLLWCRNAMFATMYLSPSAQLVSSVAPLYSLGIYQFDKCDPRILLPPTRILMWLCLRASFIVHSSFDVSVGVQ
jgi:hypothetical protein